MAFQFSDDVIDAALEAIEAAAGASAILKIYDLSGGAPANCAAAISGTVLATMNLPADWMADAAGRTKSKSGTWQDAAADAAGTADFFRVFASDGVTCHIQGPVVLGTPAAGEMGLDNTNIQAGQQVTINGFLLSD